MERSVWTDERLDDMSARVESQFELLRADIAETRADLGAEIGELRRDLREEMRHDRDRLGGELHDIRRDMFHGAIALFGSQVAILAVLLAQSL